MNSPLLSRFCEIYQTLNKDNLHLLSEVYSEQVHFIDALHDVDGLIDLKAYFEHLYSNLLFCHFDIKQVIEQEQQACLIWTMEYAHPKIKGGKNIFVHGTSHLMFTDKINYHRDYLDMGEMLYQHLPVIGSLLQIIKKRARQ